MKSAWKRIFFREMEKIALSPTLGANLGALMGLGFTTWGVTSSLPETKGKVRLVSSGEPFGVGDANAYQFANNNSLQQQSVQLPYVA
jgi:hypothetical protein